MNGHSDHVAASNGDAPYRPRNILLTGGAGFIGSHVVLRLVRRYPEYKVRLTRDGATDVSLGHCPGQTGLLCHTQQLERLS